MLILVVVINDIVVYVGGILLKDIIESWFWFVGCEFCRLERDVKIRFGVYVFIFGLF